MSELAELEVLRARIAALEAELHGREAVVRTVLGTIPGVVLRVSPALIVEYVNRVLPEFAGAPLVGQSVYAFAPPDQHEAMRVGLEQALRTRQPSSYESIALAPDGTRDWYHTTVGPLIEDGEVKGLTLVCVNVSAVKRAEHAAQESRRWLEVALRAGNVGVWSIDLAADRVVWSEQLSRMLGIPQEEAPTTMAGFRLVVPERQRPGFDRGLSMALTDGVVPLIEFRRLVGDVERTFEIQGGVQRSADGQVSHIYGGTVDVTERRALEAQVRFAQKMEAVGQLSAGVAHNFNNMLAVIVPSLELAARNVPPAEREFIEDAFQSAMQAASLVKQLMVFSRSGGQTVTQKESVDVCVRRAVELCRQTFDRRLTLTFEPDHAGPDSAVDGAQVEQALVNLLLNARDALLEARTPGAQVTVTIRRLSSGAVPREFHEVVGDYVEVAVADNGPGIEAGVLARIFEPFFSTKPLGAGTGLGLATVWATAQAHEGFADCVSTPGRGARFRLFLKQVPLTAKAPGPAQQPSRGEGRLVLVVEDEPAVARATAAVLRGAGFEVVSAVSGDEGVRLARERRFDAAILDCSMPGLAAEETLARLIHHQPGLPVLSFSGLGAPLPGATGHLSKPATPGALLDALHRAIEAVQQPPSLR